MGKATKHHSYSLEIRLLNLEHCVGFYMHCMYAYIRVYSASSSHRLIRPDDIPVVGREGYTVDDLSRLLSLALIAHKYQFAHLERWAEKFILHHSLPDSKSDLVFPRECSRESFARLSRYAVISENKILQDFILNISLQRVDSTPRTLDLVGTLNIAEKNGWRSMQGEIFYRILCEASSTMASHRTTVVASSAFRAGLSEDLNDRQKSCIMQGYFNLILASDIIMGSLNEEIGMYMQNITWKHVNLGASRKMSVDIIGRLEDLISLVKNWSAYYSTSNVKQLQEMLSKVKQELPSYFLGESKEI
jgi:hypothetical protein